MLSLYFTEDAMASKPVRAGVVHPSEELSSVLVELAGDLGLEAVSAPHLSVASLRQWVRDLSVQVVLIDVTYPIDRALGVIEQLREGLDGVTWILTTTDPRAASALSRRPEVVIDFLKPGAIDRLVRRLDTLCGILTARRKVPSQPP